MSIEIEQAHEVDDDGEACGPLDSWWAEGHHEPEAFARALAEFALAEGYEAIPRIDLADIRLVWRRHVNVGLGDAWRFDDRDQTDRPGPGFRPVTVYDLQRPRGGRQCAVRSCEAVASVRTPLSVRWALAGGEMGDEFIDVPLCPAHRRQLDATGHYWRTLVVPVGSEAVLPKPANQVVGDG